MKQIIFALVAGFLPALAVTNGAYAQFTNNIATLETTKDVIKMDKAINAENDNSVKLDVINNKAIKAFKRSYKLVNDVKWYKVSDGIRARFNENGIRNIIYYDNKGRWIASLKGYTEDKLAADIRKMVKSEYYDYVITYVDQVETTNSNGEPTYIVHLEDNKSIKQIRVNDGSMDVYREFTKDTSGN